MKKNIRINYENAAIEITKAFDKKASIPFSDEYKELKRMRDEFPSFTVVIVASSAPRKGSHKGLTYEAMEQYIEMKNDDAGKEEFQKQKELASMKASNHSYGSVRKWFLNRYPEVNKAA